MKKSKLLITGILFLINLLYAQEITIYSPIAQKFLIDEKNYIRYSPVNMFDDNPDTVYAVTFNTIRKKDNLLEIYFAEPAEFDTLSIKAGYFNKNYFKLNDRIKDISIEIWNCRNKDFENQIKLKDEQKEQILYSGKKIIATKIIIKVDSVYSGDKWDDLVISDLNFYLNSEKEPVSFGIGKCVFAEIKTSYKYDEQKRLIEKHHTAGKSGGSSTYYKYENGKTYYKEINWCDDSDYEPEFEEFIPEQIYSSNTEIFYDKNKKEIATKYSNSRSYYIDQYIYDQNGKKILSIRILQTTTYSDPVTKFFYNENGDLEEQISYEDATIYLQRYE